MPRLSRRTTGLRMTAPTSLGLALLQMGPGRARDVIWLYEAVAAAGGIVWDLELYYGLIQGGIDLPEGHPLWPILEARMAEAESRCEACGRPGEMRDALSWVRVLCDEHYRECQNGRSWDEIARAWWPRLLPERPEFWPEGAR